MDKTFLRVQVFALAFLMVSSSLAFPVLAAGALTPEKNSFDLTKWLSSPDNFGSWLSQLQASKERQAEASPPPVPEILEKHRPLSPAERMLSSLKAMEVSALEYHKHYDDDHRGSLARAIGDFVEASGSLSSKLKGEDSAGAKELDWKLYIFTKNVLDVGEKVETGNLSKTDLEQFLSDIAIVRGRRYEEVAFDRYVEREIHPQVLGSGEEVNVSGGNITLPPPVTSPLPLPEDYAESSDAPITPEIQALAANLSYDPARIYWWVYKNIRYEPYYGAMHGAEQTLISRSGNDIDTASLLIALLRASGYPARYVYGEANASRNQTLALLGTQNVSGALRLLWGAGIPAEFNGVGFRMERVWVEVYAPIYPFLSQRHWIQLDAAWKDGRGNYTRFSDYEAINSTMYNGSVLYDNSTANATLNNQTGYVADINTTFIENYMNDTINSTLLQNATEDFFLRNITSIGEAYFPLSMQYRFNRSYEYSTLPDPLQYKVSLFVYAPNKTLFIHYNNLTNISGKSFVLDFLPSTPADKQKMENGTDAYEVNVSANLFLNGTQVNGSANITLYNVTNATWGEDVNVSLSLSLADTVTVKKGLKAGERSAIVFDAPRTGYTQYNRTFTRARWLQNNSDNETANRESLYLMGENFFTSSNLYTDRLADDFGSHWTRPRAAVVFVTKNKKVDSFNGTPINVTEGGTNIDLKYDQITTSSEKNTTINFNLQRGLALSGYEGAVLEIFYQNVTGISTTSILTKAIQTNVSIFFISNDTLGRLDNLSIPQEDKDIIKTYLNGSPDFFAMVPNGSFQIGNWSGVGYAIIDSSSGAGRYLISGGLNGGVVNTITGLTTIDSCGKLALAIGIAIPLVAVTAACAAGLAMPPTAIGAIIFCGAVYNADKRILSFIFRKLIVDFAIHGGHSKNIDTFVETWNKCT